MSPSRERIPTETWTLPRPRPDSFVGGFPLHFELKLYRLLGTLNGGDPPGLCLHPFGGVVTSKGSTTVHTADLNETTAPDFLADAHDLHMIPSNTYDATVCDPPYSDDEAEMLYGTPELKWSVWSKEAVRVTKPGGHVVIYLDKQPPRPAGTRLVHRVVVLTRTWHRARVCFIFEKINPYEEDTARTLASLERDRQRRLEAASASRLRPPEASGSAWPHGAGNGD